MSDHGKILTEIEVSTSETLSRLYRERLRDIEDAIRDIESRTGGDPKAAIAAMTEDEYRYIRTLAIVP